MDLIKLECILNNDLCDVFIKNGTGPGTPAPAVDCFGSSVSHKPVPKFDPVLRCGLNAAKQGVVRCKLEAKCICDP